MYIFNYDISCSDATPGCAEYYLDNFREFVEGVRKELGYEIPFFTMQLNRQINGAYDACWGMVREAQRRAAKEIPGVSLITTTNLSLSDDIHNSASANVSLGEKLARQCGAILNGLEEYQPPEVVDVAWASREEKQKYKLDGNGIWMRVTCEHVKTCLVIYSTEGEDSGFSLMDEEGEIHILHICGSRENKNHLYLELGRKPRGTSELSFAWQADPVKLPPVDEVTYMPLVSFYKRKLNL